MYVHGQIGKKKKKNNYHIIHDWTDIIIRSTKIGNRMKDRTYSW